MATELDIMGQIDDVGRKIELRMSEREALLKAAQLAYVSLLKLPTAFRVSRQHGLVELREAIALATDKDAEEVQNYYTAKAWAE